MPKYGLGRGLSSLFTTYEEPEPKKEVKKVKKVQTEDVKPQKLEDIEETIENDKYLEEKQNLSKKLSKIEKTLPSSSKIDNYDNEKIFEIPLSKIDPNVNQPRKNFDKDSLLELAESIRQHGVIQPILVLQKGERYSIIAGERRFKAARMANLKTIPCIIKGYSTKQVKEVALVENVQREDLNPVETAFAIKHLIDDYGLAQEEIAEKIGKTRSVVVNYLRILKLEPEVLTMVEKGQLTFAHAKALVAIEDRDTQIKLAKKSSNGKISSRELEVIVQKLVNPDKIKKKKANIGLELGNLITNMQHLFGTKVNVIGSDKRGRIYIDYYNSDDLDRIANILNKLD